jgi:hypothetical protein
VSFSGLKYLQLKCITIDKSYKKWVGTLNTGLEKHSGTDSTVINEKQDKFVTVEMVY